MQFNSSNILQQEETFISWKQHEESLWLRNIQSSFGILIMTASSVRLFWSLFVDFTTWEYVAVMIVSLLLSTWILMTTPESSVSQKLQRMVFLTMAQGYSVFMVLNVHSNSFSLWCICSTLLFCVYEMSSFRDWWVVVLMLFRQFAVWKIIAVYLEIETLSYRLPYFLMTGAVFLVLYCVNQRRKQAIEKYSLFESLEEQHIKMRSILQAIPEGLAVILESLEVPCFNSKLGSILRLNEKTGSVAEKLGMVFCAESDTTDFSLMRQIQLFVDNTAKESITFGVTLMEEKYYEWKGTKCVWGKNAACILTASDISSWVSVRSKLQQESDSKTSLLRFVSHELRTPTNAILNLVSNVMAAENLKQDQKTDLSIVITSTHFLLSVINDLLDFSRMIADRFSLVKQSFDIRKELYETVQLIELQCAQKGLFLTTKIDDLVPRLVFSDPNRVKQILLNLLGNALKFTFRGGIRVICMMTDNDSLKISVKDTGVGIPSHKIAGLCKAFGTIEATQRINPQGCGLGLYISNLLAQSLGSKPIKISSKEAVGSEFSFTVSIYQETFLTFEFLTDYTSESIEDEREAESPVCNTIYVGGKGESHIRLPDILIVDDSDFNRLVLVKMLGSFGLRVDTATTGLRALSIIRERIRRGHCYRLILMDVEMPEMDGVTATQEIRTLELTGELTQSPRIVACSAHRGREDYDRCIRAGMNGYIEKPISKHRLQEVVHSLRLT